MKKVASKYILIMLMLLVTLSSLSITTFAIEKKDDQGEILNLPPFVDFEVKEKRKVDVIVDVGNTSYTTEQINSMVNDQLRAKLQENGVDYKIHVEKSSEGATRQYYFSAPPGEIYGTDGLYYYDIVTKQHTFVKNIKSDFMSIYGNSGGYIDPETNMIYSGINGGYPFAVSADGTDTAFRFSYVVGITKDGNLLTDYYDSWFTRYSRAIMNAKESASYIRSKGQGAYPSNYTQNDQYVRTFFPLPNNHVVWGTLQNDGVTYMNISSTAKEFLNYNAGISNTPRPYLSLPTFRGKMKYFKESEDIIYLYLQADGYNIVTDYSVRIRNSKTGKETEFESRNSDIYVGLTNIEFFPLDGNRLIYNGIYDRATYLYEDYHDNTKRVKLSDEPIFIQSYVGNNIFYNVRTVDNWTGNMETGVMNIDTGEKAQFEYNRATSFIKYPDWYVSKQRKITDIIEEVPYRTDAEKYYVRIDDLSIPHLDRESTLGNSITTLSKNQIDYISIGNSNNEAVTKKIQSALGTTQRYNISEIQTAFSKVGSYITDRKEVDLHILMAKSGVADATIKTTLKSMTTNLLKDNIIVTPHYVKGTDNSTLYELLNQVNWRDDRNNYVLFLHQGMMSEFSDPLVEEEISLLLKGNYAFFTAMGSTSNKGANESLIASNNGNGYFFAGTNISYMTTKLNEYMVQTAVKNPKRVSDTLVLNYDSTTGDYSSEVLINTYYEDFENDRKINERFLTTHDSSVYENNTGIMEGIGQYQESPTTKFTKVGLYEMVVQVQDDPTANANFSNYNLWSQDSLSRLVLYVHRAPVAEFSAIVNSSKVLTIKDYSYDLDRYSQRNKGITTWVWKWKKVDDAEWTIGKPPTTLQANTDYFVSLKVKDIDGAWSSEVVKYVTTNPYKQPPVALFTIDPKSVSWSKQATITDLSYDPDNGPIITRSWKVYRDNQLILSSGKTPTISQIKASATAAGLNTLGTYRLSLQVQNSQNLWSEWYTDYLEIINFPPIADFEPLEDTYRNTVNKVTNTTANPDQDGDNVTYQWKLSYDGKTYSIGTAQHPSFKIKDLGLGKLAVGTWQLELKASDPLGASSYMTRSFNVLNRTPTTTIASGRSTGYINEPYPYTSTRSDADTEDVASLQSFWRLTSPSGKVKEWYTQNISITYVEKGSYVLENWVVDQLGAKSDVEKKNITILNQAPIPGFTMSPNPTYRGVDINFVSKATDMDGYIDKTTYYIVHRDGTMAAISGMGDFQRPFSTVGVFTIKQVVVDNDSASAEISKELVIQNRIPVANITSPSGTSAATATKVGAYPKIEWTYSDEDSDLQVRYNVVVRNASGKQMYATGPVTSKSQAIMISNTDSLEEKVIYNVSVQVFDGYDWSAWSTLKYFYIIKNQAPVSGFTCTPNPAYEGDTVNCTNTSTDPDGDAMTYLWTVKGPKSYSVTHTSTNISIPKAVTENGVGTYSITLKATDSNGASNENDAKGSVVILPLSITGAVNHTAEWEANRQRWNNVNANDFRPADTFWAGEGFDLVGSPTVTSSAGGSTTVANKVEVVANYIGKKNLDRQTAAKWTGYLGQEHTTVELEKLSNGAYDFVFTVTYSNGVLKKDTVRIYILNNWLEYFRFHKDF